MTDTKRDIVKLVLDGERPPYVPWHCSFTREAQAKLVEHFGTDDIECAVDNHFLKLGPRVGLMTDLGNDRVQDFFGAVWDRSIDKDIGVLANCLLPEPTLEHYQFPDPHDPKFFDSIPATIDRHGDLFRVYSLGFSLYERAWTLRGMENLMFDFYEHPDFVDNLFNAIGQWNLAHLDEVLKYPVDAVHFGDDYGNQRGLQISPEMWHRFIYPVLKQMYGRVREAGIVVSIHSCGAVDRLFDDLIDIGLQCFNPFQPEVMNVWELLPRYRGRLTFHGGLSTQRTLPYGSPDDVRDETRRLLESGRDGSYVFAPAHYVEGDVPPENMLAFLDIIQSQPGYGG